MKPTILQFVCWWLNLSQTLGNHEFDNGVEGLIPFLRNVTFPIVCSNMDITSEPSFPKGIVKKYHVLKVGGESIGVIGYITEDVPQLSVTGRYYTQTL